MQKHGHVLVVHAPQMLQHRPPAGGDTAQQPHGTAGVLPDAELPALNSIDAADERLDLLRKFLGTAKERRE